MSTPRAVARAALSCFVFSVFTALRQSPAAASAPHSPVYSPSQSRDGLPSCARELIVTYETDTLLAAAPRGRGVYAEYEAVAAFLQSKAGVAVESHRPLHALLVDRMSGASQTEAEVWRGAAVLHGAAEDIGALKRTSLARSFVVAIRARGDEFAAAAERAKSCAGLATPEGYRITSVEVNGLSRTFNAPNDPLYPSQWAHHKTCASSGWDIEVGDPEIIIAIIDTGVELTHEDLKGNLVDGYDFVDIDTAAYRATGYILLAGEDYVGTDSVPSDYYGHGTHCAGIAGAVGGNAIGVSGVCRVCSLLPVRAGFAIEIPDVGQAGFLEDDDIINAVDYAIFRGADVISMSFGGSRSSAMEAALANAYGLGIVLVASAGNDAVDRASYPAGLDFVIAVAATDSLDMKASFSSYGTWVDISAPGVDILSTVPHAGGVLSDPSGYRACSGTSMAAPYVAGLAALLLAQAERGPEEIRGLLASTVDLPGESSFYIGAGRVNNFRALRRETLPTARCLIREPADGAVIGRDTIVRGTATGESYALCIGEGLYPSRWTEIASGGPVEDGVLGMLSVSNLPRDSVYSLCLASWDSSGAVECRSTVCYVSGMREGWPQKASTGLWTPLVVGDLEGDGCAEIFAAGWDRPSHVLPESLYAWDCTGSRLEGWPKQVRCGPPSLADIDGDGDLEVIAQDVKQEGAAVCVWHHTGDIAAPGWPQPVDSCFQPLASPAIGDVDSDGSPEIITVFNHYCGASDPRARTSLYCWEPDGSLSPGSWPRDLSIAEQTYAWATPSLGDIDGDGDLDIVQLVTNWAGGFQLHVLDAVGDYLPGWPRILSGLHVASASPAVADLDGDGAAEIVVTVTAPPAVYVFKSDGRPFTPQWPQDFPMSIAASPAVGDVNADGVLEIVVTLADSEVHVLDCYAAVDLPGWPQRIGNWTQIHYHAAPIIADMDGDSIPEVAAVGSCERGDAFPKMYAFHSDGSLVAGWPKPVYQSHPIVPATPALADIDGDAALDAVAASTDGHVYVWDLPGPFTAALQEWPQHQHDPQHSGLYGYQIPHLLRRNPRARAAPSMEQNYPNPFNPLTKIRYETGEDGPVIIRIYNVKGEMIRTVEAAFRKSGRYAVVWDGRDRNGHAVASGVYFCRLAAGGRTTTRKLVLLR